jgi:hypothetical protein
MPQPIFPMRYGQRNRRSMIVTSRCPTLQRDGCIAPKRWRFIQKGPAGEFAHIIAMAAAKTRKKPPNASSRRNSSTVERVHLTDLIRAEVTVPVLGAANQAQRLCSAI